MKRVLFVCHGNICRSPMAEFVAKDYVARLHLEGQLYFESRATSGEEIWGGVGNPIYPPAAQTLRLHGVPYDKDKRAQRLSAADCRQYDLLVAMDNNNRRNILRAFPAAADKVRLLLQYADGGEVADPWYTGDFERAFCDIERGIKALIPAVLAE